MTLVHLCLSVLLTVISLIVFIFTVSYELINDVDDDECFSTRQKYCVSTG